MDVLTKRQRSYCMSQIRGRDTTWEVTFRKYAWGKGVKGYKVRNKVFGRPDMYFPVKKLAVFIDGCFWHKCPGCFVKPRNNKIFWERKITSNVRRDAKTSKRLSKEGIAILRFWEHEVEYDLRRCYRRLERALNRLEKRNKARV